MKIYSELEAAANRYNKLRDVFGQFHRLTKEMPDFGTPPRMKALVVGDLIEETRFDMTMAGTTVQVRLSFRPADEKPRGRMTAYVIDSLVKLEPALVVRFTTEGNTDANHANDDPTNLTERPDAFFIAASMMQAGLNREA
jgi:hypothetical protein